MTTKTYPIIPITLGLILWVGVLWVMDVASDAVISLLDPPQGGYVILKILLMLAGIIVVVGKVSFETSLTKGDE